MQSSSFGKRAKEDLYVKEQSSCGGGGVACGDLSNGGKGVGRGRADGVGQ